MITKHSPDKSPALTPIVKCAGGKRQLLGAILPRVPSDFNTYVEPFVGGGAVLLALRPEKAIVADRSLELVFVYRAVRDNPAELIRLLRSQPNSADEFYRIRNLDREPEGFAKLTEVERAARYIFLNKMAFNGLWRVNKSGQMNSPYGGYTAPKICDEAGIYALSDYLRSNDITIVSSDFADVCRRAMPGSFVYLDPPYDPRSETANFTAYTAGGFSEDDQRRLKATCDDLTRRGINFMLSNASTEFIKELYKDYLVETVHARRAINSKGDRRGPVDEVLIRNYGGSM